MYSEMIASKVDKMFNELYLEVKTIVNETVSLNDAINNIFQRVSLETALRSKLMLGDMLFELDRVLFKTPFFADDYSRRNEFSALNLRKEITSKYQFTSTVTVDYQEASRVLNACKVGSSVFAVGGVLGIGIVLSSGLLLSSVVPVPIGVLFAAAIGAAIVDYLFIEPKKSKKRFSSAIEKYLNEAKEQYLSWFDSVESYYNARVEQIKETIQGV
ncbi:YtxH domain-containing protein [Pectobacterium polaris]|uniref:YtxH domain-containing protein n=1 Tax=Pectobacterium polaris TaxID=2042057 RepID=UPI0015826EF5|nr:YtxH domain-containing protein [Pectobacterium polaris]